MSELSVHLLQDSYYPVKQLVKAGERVADSKLTAPAESRGKLRPRADFFAD